jgi:hypothetical protein
MNRDGAETFLRLLAEAELRDPVSVPRAPRPADAPPGTISAVLARAAWVLVAIGALDLATAEAVVADAELAMAARLRPDPPGAAVTGLRGRPHRFADVRLTARHWRAARPGGPPARAPGGPERYVPVGRMISFHDEWMSGELDVMAYAHTGSGARLVAVWHTRDPLGSHHHGLPPVQAFTVTDDRGQGYELGFGTRGRPEATCDLSLHPDPPPGIRWLAVTAPGEQAVRIDLERRAEPSAPQVGQLELSLGEHMLNRIAERLLTLATEFPPGPRPDPGPLANVAAGLGATIAALQAAEVLPARSPVPGQLAALCASLDVRGHGITAAPATDLPESWLSLLSYYHRRKPWSGPAGDGFAAVAACLPELENVRLVLLGLHNHDGSSWMDALALGRLPVLQQGPLGLDMAFPLSVWIRDDAGRWHVARPSGWYDQGGEAALTLRLAPALTRSPTWIEVRAAGRSAQVRTRLPVQWG